MANGYYFTANKNYVVATGSWIANYHTVNPGQIIMKNSDNFMGIQTSYIKEQLFPREV